MTREFVEVVSHKTKECNGIRMLMAIVPGSDIKKGYVIIKLQKRMGQSEWDSDTEYEASLSCDDIGRLLVVLNGCKKGAMNIGVGDTRVSLIHALKITSNSEYVLDLYNTSGMMCINLSIHEAVIIREILRSAIFRIIFG